MTSGVLLWDQLCISYTINRIFYQNFVWMLLENVVIFIAWVYIGEWSKYVDVFLIRCKHLCFGITWWCWDDSSFGQFRFDLYIKVLAQQLQQFRRLCCVLNWTYIKLIPKLDSYWYLLICQSDLKTLGYPGIKFDLERFTKY